MQKLSLFLLSACLLIFACEQDLPGPVPRTQWVDFANPQPGQSTYYLRYTTQCDHLDRDFEYTRDTLILSVVESGATITFEERFTPGSPFYKDGMVEPVRYEIISTGDYALIPDRFSSALFFFYGNDTLRLNSDYTAVLEQDVCRLKIEEEEFIGNEIGRLRNFELGPLQQKDKTAVSCVPLMLSLDAYLIYDKQHLFMSHTIVQDGTVRGWVALE